MVFLVPRPSGHKLNRSAWDDLLDALGLNIPLVAERSGVPASTLRTIVAGHDKASVPMAHKIARGVGCEPQSIFPTLGEFALEAA